jgi:uncharacterized membrane protein
MHNFRRFFLRGFAALIPSLLTIAILVWAYALVHDYVGVPITHGLLSLCRAVYAQPPPGWVNADTDPMEYGTPIDEWDSVGRRLTIEFKVIHYDISRLSDPKLIKAATRARNAALWRIAFEKWNLHLLGFLIAILLVYFMGYFLASFIGRATWRAAEGLLHRTPVIRAVYPHVKQVTDFLLSERGIDFSGVVAVQYPRKGLWSLGLRTGGPMASVQEASPEELVTVFVPSSPTPMTGYVIQVPRHEIIELNLTIDEALRFTVSGGVIKPGAILPELDKETSRAEKA